MNNLKQHLFYLLFVVIVSQTINAQETPAKSFQKTFKMEGRIMFDFNFLSAGDSLDFAGNEFRRVRWATKGKLAENLAYKVEFDFSGGAVNFRDVYLNYLLPTNAGSIILGSFTEPTSLNNMTSSKYITFFERAMMSNTQPYKYNAGIMYNNQKLWNENLGIQLAYTFNGKNKKAFKDEALRGGSNFIARVTTALVRNDKRHQVLHVGVNYENRQNDSEEYKYRFRVENHMGDKHEVSGVGVFKNTSDIGFELGGTYGALSLQAEYEMSSILTDIDTYNAAGYYAFVSYFLTGEHRPYKNSSFGRVKPKNNFCLKNRKFGALELATRYSVMDFSNYPNVNTTNKIANITAGFNWYLNKYARVMYNYTYADFNDMNQLYGDNALKGHLLRFQLDF